MRVIQIQQSDPCISISEITITITSKGFFRNILNLNEKVEVYKGTSGSWYKYPNATYCWPLKQNMLDKIYKQYRWGLFQIENKSKNKLALLSHEEIERELDKALKEENYEL